MKKRYISFLLALLTVLATTILLTQPSEAQVTGSFSITIVPDEGGTVTSNFPPGPYPMGTYITLLAEPAPGYTFTGWSDTVPGGVSGTEPSTDFFIDGDHEITATFTQVTKPCYTLTTTANPTAGGSITVPVDGACPAPGQFTEGSTRTITASANDGYKFDKWTGSAGTVDPAQENSTSITVTMDQDRSLTANFTKVCQPLTLSTNGQGADIVANPLKRTCPNDYEFKAGETTTLTAAPAAGWKVTSWEIGATNIPKSDVTHPLTMPSLPFGQGLLVQVNYEEKATFGFASSLKTVAEDAGTVNIQVIRAENTLSDAGTIKFNTVDGTATAGKDYVAKSGNLNFAKGQNSATISITILEDNIAEPTKSFTVQLSKTDSNIKLGITSAVIQIIDNEGNPTVRFEEPVYTVDESEVSAIVAVTVSPLPEEGEVVVELSTQDGTATAGEDYVAIKNRPVVIRVPQGQTRQTVRIDLIPDDLDEPDETVKLMLSNPSSNVELPEPDAVLKIIDDDDPPAVSFSKAEYSAQKSSGPTVQIPVNLSEPSGQEVNVDYKVTLERTGETAQGTLVFAAGELTNDFIVPVASAVANDVFSLQLSNPVNAELRTDDPQLPNAARLVVLDSNCHELAFSFTGYGQPPSPIGKESSLGCPAGHYVAGELVDITAQPDTGWYVASWSGTNDDESASLQNAVEMPDAPLTVSAAYRVPIFFAVVNKAQEQFAGPNEEEPNNLFSQANGPILMNKDYRGDFSSDEDINDLYYFLLDQQTTVSITLKDIPSGRDYDIVLYDDDWIIGKIVAESREFDNLPEKIEEQLPPGRYYIQVYAGESKPSSANYRLRVATN